MQRITCGTLDRIWEAVCVLFEVQFSLQLQELARTTKYSNRNSRCSGEDSKHEAYLKKTWNFRRGIDGLYSVLYYIVYL